MAKENWRGIIDEADFPKYENLLAMATADQRIIFLSLVRRCERKQIMVPWIEIYVIKCSLDLTTCHLQTWDSLIIFIKRNRKLIIHGYIKLIDLLIEIFTSLYVFRVYWFLCLIFFCVIIIVKIRKKLNIKEHTEGSGTK